MKGQSIFALLSVLVLMAISCGTETPEEEDVDKCQINPDAFAFGDVEIGDYECYSLKVKAASSREPHIEGIVKINCPGFTFCDPESGAPIDSFVYNLNYPATDTFCVRFEPTEVRIYECEVDFGEDCKPLSLSGRGIEPQEGDWELTVPITDKDLFDVFVDHTGYAVIVGDSGMVLRKTAELEIFSVWVSHGFDDLKLKAVWKDNTNRVYVAGGEIAPGNNKIFRYTFDWGVLDSDYRMSYYSSIWGAADCDIYFGGFGLMSIGGINVKRYICEGFVTYELFMGMSEVCGVSGSSASDVWAVLRQPGTNHVHHFDGGAWSVQEESWMSATLEDVWVSGDGEVFVVGSGGAIYHRDGAGWHDNSIQGFDGSFYGVWGTTADDVFAVGSGSSIYHYNGSTWTAQSVPGPHTKALYSVWGSGSSDVWAVGQGGVVLHYH